MNVILHETDRVPIMYFNFTKNYIGDYHSMLSCLNRIETIYLI